MYLGRRQHILKRSLLLALSLLLPINLTLLPTALADTQSSSQSVNVTATVPGPPPTTPAIILQPSNGSTVSVTPVVISGTCGNGLLVKVFDNGREIGSTICDASGQFSINTSLIVGQNELQAFNYDTLNQAGPTSGTVLVTVITPASSSKPTGSKKNSQLPTGSATTPSGNSSTTPTTPAIVPAPIRKLVHDLSQVHILLWAFILLLVLFLLLGYYQKRRRKHTKPIRFEPPS